MGSMALGLGSIGAGAIGKDQALSSSVEGAKAQARVEKLNQQYQQKEFENQIKRQQPFLDVGNLALPQFIEALSNRGDVSNLPGTTIQRDLISDFLGDQAPDYVREDAIGNLEAVEAERNKGRLTDLINIGLGGVGSSAGSMVNLGTTLGNSIGTQGNILSQSLQDSATGRQNMANQLTTSLSGIPAFLNSQQQQGYTMSNIGTPQYTNQIDLNQRRSQR